MAQSESALGRLEDHYYDNMLNKHLSQYEERDYTMRDEKEARDNATDYVIGSEDAIYDLCCGEFGTIDRLTFIMAKLAGSYGSDALYWLDKYKDELAAKLEKLIDARYEVELEKLYD